ncbi:MAG: HAMP domain-containing sensor histidine kinase [Porphyromonas sp.]|nr:HAMP domain-containing sensor histidine kinase [Porphyromonas sp.]
MNKRITSIIIFILVAIMIVSILTQTSYLRSAHRMRNEQFSKLAHSAMNEVAKLVEKDEMRRVLTNGILLSDIGLSLPQDQKQRDTLINYFGESIWDNLSGDYATCPPWAKEQPDNLSNPTTALHQQDFILFNAYFYHRELLEELALNAVMEIEDRPLLQRFDTRFLTRSIERELAKLDINDPFIYRIFDQQQQLIYSYGDFSKYDEEKLFSVRQSFFVDHRNTTPTPTSFVQVYFPSHYRYMNAAQYATSTFITIGILVILCLIAVIMLFKQQQFLQSRRDFSNNMTHELKTPISSIKLAWEMLNDPVIEASPANKERLLKVIEVETRRLSMIVEKVLQFSLVDGRKIKFHPEELDALELLLEIAGVYTFKVEEIGGELDLNLEAENNWIFADKMNLQNVIFNLLDNAVKYRKPDIPLKLTLSTYNHNNKLIICVEDNGIGIAKEDRKRIFDQFYRVHTGELHDVKGFGLGLAYVLGVVKEMKGSVRAEGKLGVGTKMIIELPNHEMEG